MLSAGQYQLRSFATIPVVAVEPNGVLVEFASGVRADVQRSQVRIVAPEGPLVPEPDASVADWIAEQLSVPAHDPLAALTVSTVVPGEFAAVVRIEHANPESEGEVDRATAAALVDVLRPHTTTPDDVVFAIWEGWGDLPASAYPGAAALALPDRNYFLLRGPIEALLHPIDIMAFADTCRAAIWWPSDRAWVGVTEIDFSWTFVAGSETLGEKLRNDEGLSATRVSPDDTANRPNG